MIRQESIKSTHETPAKQIFQQVAQLQHNFHNNNQNTNDSKINQQTSHQLYTPQTNNRGKVSQQSQIIKNQKEVQKKQENLPQSQNKKNSMQIQIQNKKQALSTSQVIKNDILSLNKQEVLSQSTIIKNDMQIQHKQPQIINTSQQEIFKQKNTCKNHHQFHCQCTQNTQHNQPETNSISNKIDNTPIDNNDNQQQIRYYIGFDQQQQQENHYRFYIEQQLQRLRQYQKIYQQEIQDNSSDSDSDSDSDSSSDGLDQQQINKIVNQKKQERLEKIKMLKQQVRIQNVIKNLDQFKSKNSLFSQKNKSTSRKIQQQVRKIHQNNRIKQAQNDILQRPIPVENLSKFPKMHSARQLLQKINKQYFINLQNGDKSKLSIENSQNTSNTLNTSNNFNTPNTQNVTKKVKFYPHIGLKLFSKQKQITDTKQRNQIIVKLNNQQKSISFIQKSPNYVWYHNQQHEQINHQKQQYQLKIKQELKKLFTPYELICNGINPQQLRSYLQVRRLIQRKKKQLRTNCNKQLVLSHQVQADIVSLRNHKRETFILEIQEQLNNNTYKYNIS